jgi:hypothetical protein
MKDLAEKRNANVFFVINPFRPGFGTEKELKENFEHMCNLSTMRATHIIANPNLSGSTDIKSFNEGIELIESFAKKQNVPIAFFVVETSLAENLNREKIAAPDFFYWNDSLVFAIRRYWDTPWQFGDVANY